VKIRNNESERVTSPLRPLKDEVPGKNNGKILIVEKVILRYKP